MLKKMRKNKGGFTLIELLVVITIITLLVSILLPALSAARNAANSIACLSNQKQIMISLNTYAMDHDDYLPYNEDTTAQGTDNGAHTYTLWPGALAGKGTGHYVNDPQVFMDPARLGMGATNQVLQEIRKAATGGSGKYSAYWARVSYGANRYGAFNQSTHGKSLRLGQAQVPVSKLMALTDWVSPNQDNATHKYYGWYEATVNDGAKGYPWTHPGVGVNLVYLDGHGATVKPQQLGWYPDEQIWGYPPGITYATFHQTWVHNPPWYYKEFIGNN